MSPSAPIEPNKNRTLPEPSTSGELSPERGELENLRGVRWRMDLGILPSSSSTVDHFRRLAANRRRSYAALRRRLLISHISKDERNFRDLVMDNPLSQNPDSMWGLFFHKAELEKMVDQDLSRLYPEHGSYFQTPERQGVLRRILLLWCIRHPNYGYRQGMHELLAPLLYVLQADLERLSEVRKLYQDYFTDNFDGLSFNVTELSYISDVENSETQKDKDKVKVNNFNDLDPKIQTVISFSDAYGAEGELGIVLSEKFMEHDAYSMFDALMNGDNGAVAMARFYSHSPLGNGLPPVIEASSALYRLLSTVDFSLYTHLVELGVEPQYFALRWFRVLFGREFALEDLLVIWDEILKLDNNKLNGFKKECEIVSSLRGAFISALAVAMILYLRSSLLATENATSCLQRLLNFPEDVNLGKLVKKAKSLMNLAIALLEVGKPRGHRHSQSPSSDVAADVSSGGLVRGSYWEEKWRVMNDEQEDGKQVGISRQVQDRIMGWSEKVKARLWLSKVARSHVRSSTMDDLTSHLYENEKLVSGNASQGYDTARSSVSVASTSSGIRPEPDTGSGSGPLGVGSNSEAVVDSGDGSSKFQWLWMFAKSGPEGLLDKPEATTCSDLNRINKMLY